MKTILSTIVMICICSTMTFSQKNQFKISNDEITIPFGNSVIISSVIERNNLRNHKFLFHSKITGILDYNTAFDNIYFDNFPLKLIAFNFCKIQCCGAETTSLITKNNIGKEFSFKYKTVHSENKYNSSGNSNSKNLTSITFEGISSALEAIILYDFEIIE